MSGSNTEFLVNKNDFFTTTFLDSERPIAKKNEVLLKIEKYAFTSNNITYAVMGNTLYYWNFFPSKESNGIIPVWGFANVVSSNHKNILVGDRYYGYFPMSNYLKVIPKNINAMVRCIATDHGLLASITVNPPNILCNNNITNSNKEAFHNFL